MRHAGPLHLQAEDIEPNVPNMENEQNEDIQNIGSNDDDSANDQNVNEIDMELNGAMQDDSSANTTQEVVGAENVAMQDEASANSSENLGQKPAITTQEVVGAENDAMKDEASANSSENLRQKLAIVNISNTPTPMQVVDRRNTIAHERNARVIYTVRPVVLASPSNNRNKLPAIARDVIMPNIPSVSNSSTNNDNGLTEIPLQQQRMANVSNTLIPKRRQSLYDRNVRIGRPENATQVESLIRRSQRNRKPVHRYNVGITLCCVCNKSYRHDDVEHYGGQVVCSIACFKKGN
ncbi:uncharacterized protein LOC116350872 [Contarinia nasturtii]|uniref:uncharacterized protein LOC116350872 n=1 Tax=Contarinia nasturtii TaxID=265458 RepID=UPI0012D3A8B2|nr:uncharacterized protein LOC116350872 [Contarinia nasturtii]